MASKAFLARNQAANFVLSGDPLGALAVAIVEQAAREAPRCPRARQWLDQLRRDVAAGAPHRFRVEPAPAEDDSPLGLAELGGLLQSQASG